MPKGRGGEAREGVRRGAELQAAPPGRPNPVLYKRRYSTDSLSSTCPFNGFFNGPGAASGLPLCISGLKEEADSQRVRLAGVVVRARLELNFSIT